MFKSRTEQTQPLFKFEMNQVFDFIFLRLSALGSLSQTSKYKCQNLTQKIFFVLLAQEQAIRKPACERSPGWISKKTIYQLSKSKSRSNLFILGHYCSSGPSSYNYKARKDSVLCLKETPIYQYLPKCPSWACPHNQPYCTTMTEKNTSKIYQHCTQELYMCVMHCL